MYHLHWHRTIKVVYNQIFSSIIVSYWIWFFHYSNSEMFGQRMIILVQLESVQRMSSCVCLISSKWIFPPVREKTHVILTHNQTACLYKALDKWNGQLISQFFTLSLSEGVILQLLRCDFHSSGLQSSLSVMCQPIWGFDIPSALPPPPPCATPRAFGLLKIIFYKFPLFKCLTHFFVKGFDLVDLSFWAIH